MTPSEDKERRKKMPSRFDDFVVTDPKTSKKGRSNISIFECLDLIEAEFERRFSSSENVQLWQFFF